MIRVPIPILGVLLLAAVATAKDADVTGKLTRKTLSLMEREALPHLRVEVGAGRPLTVRGRSDPVKFREGDGGLEAGREVLGDGDTLEVWLDDDETIEVAFRKGDPAAGEPAWRAISLGALEGKIGRTKVRFVDHDGDGTFLTPHRDFLHVAKTGEVHPVAEHVVLGREVYRLTTDEAARTITWRKVTKTFASPDVFPGWAGVAAGLAHLNRLRAGMNLPPVRLDREASRHALLHLKYCSLNGGNPHQEEEDRPGYTREGASAGIHSIGWLGAGSGVVSVIDGQLASLLHRMDLIDPRKTAIGIATGSNRVWIHVECGKYRPWEGQGPSIFPGPGGKWPVGVYAVDNPDPRPKGEQQATGIPVTVAWFGEEDGVLKVRAELFAGRRKVACLTNQSGRHDLKSNAPKARAVLMARSPLSSGTYEVRVTWKQHGEEKHLTHRFRIGR
ncbi:MAG: CAP domain-containing protein [Planctomycetota bacterium]